MLTGTANFLRRRLAVVDSLGLFGQKVVHQVGLFQKWGVTLNLVVAE